MTIYAYIRVSSSKQTLEHQHYEIKQFADKNKIQIDQFIEETISSRKSLNKRQLGQLLDNLQNGDMLITTEISRLGRSLIEVMQILQICLNKKCKIWTLKENYRLGNDIQSKMMAFTFGMAAEIERDLISQRTKASLENVKSRGKKLGRPFGCQLSKLKLSKNTKRVKELLEKGISKRKIAKIMGVQTITLRRFIQRMGWDV